MEFQGCDEIYDKKGILKIDVYIGRIAVNASHKIFYPFNRTFYFQEQSYSNAYYKYSIDGWLDFTTDYILSVLDTTQYI